MTNGDSTDIYLQVFYSETNIYQSLQGQVEIMNVRPIVSIVLKIESSFYQKSIHLTNHYQGHLK